jgi:hypothetical protein
VYTYYAILALLSSVAMAPLPGTEGLEPPPYVPPVSAIATPETPAPSRMPATPAPSVVPVAASVTPAPEPAEPASWIPSPPTRATKPSPLPERRWADEDVPTAHQKLSPPPEPGARPWMLSVEGATRAPVDLGVQATLEFPFRIRVSAGYGWVPNAYSGVFTKIASSASGNAQVSAVLDHASYQGRTFRAAIGVRPFARGGLHLDVGYARLALDGALDLADSGVAVLQALGGGYRAHTSVDAWHVEVGSQVEAWGVVFGFAFGLMRTFAAETSISAVNGAPTGAVLASAAQQTDAALKTYGYVPTLTLRLGFDVLSPTRY